MIVTVTSYKGGVGKTTTSIHLAAYLQRLAPTLLVDGDGIRSATKWSLRGTGHGLPFKVIPAAQMAKHLRDYEHVVIDTEGNPSDEDFRELAEGCDLMVIPAEPETVATDGLIHTLEKLQALKVERYKVLLTKVPPPPRTEGKQLREMLIAEASRSSHRRSPGWQPLRRQRREECRSTTLRTNAQLAHGTPTRQ